MSGGYNGVSPTVNDGKSPTPGQTYAGVGSSGIKYDAAGRPIAPSFGSQYDPTSGRLANPGLNLNVGPGLAGQLNTQGLSAIRSQALSTGQSPWAKMQMDRQLHDQRGVLDQQASMGNGAMAGALSNLAMGGGLSAGARERMAKSQARENMISSQAIRQQGMSDRLGIGVKDQERKDTMLMALPGMELDALKPAQLDREMKAKEQEFNISNALNEITSKRLYDANQFTEAMRAWGASKQGEAIARSGGKK